MTIHYSDYISSARLEVCAIDHKYGGISRGISSPM